MKSGALLSSIMNHSIHDKKMSETPPKIVHSDAMLFVVTVKLSDPFVEGTLNLKIVMIV